MRSGKPVVLNHPGQMWSWGDDHEEAPTLGRASWDDANRAEDAMIEALEGTNFVTRYRFEKTGRYSFKTHRT